MRARRLSLTVAHVNLVLLASMAAVLVSSVVMGDWPTYRMLSFREVFLILLPAVGVVVALKLPAARKARLLRLRWPGGRLVAASALIGAGGWLIDSWLAVVVAELFGYTTPLPPDFYPTTPGRALILFAVLALLAPICEETLFRGVIQRGYEELGPRAGILAGGALFALFHQSLPQGLALLPLAFTLGYLVWRSDSLITGIIAHATNNALAGVLIVAATADPEIAPWIGTPPGALAGLALLWAGLRGVRRWTAPPAAVDGAPPIRQRRRALFWLARFWPLLLIGPIAAFSIGLEATLGWFPEALALGQPVRWSSPPWDGPRTWTYEVRNALGEAVGEVRCSLALEEAAYLLTCDRQQAAYEADTGREVYAGPDLDEQLTARWQRPDLRLSSVERRVQITTTEGTAGERTSSIVVGADVVEGTFSRDDGTIAEFTWPLAPTSSPLWPDRAFPPTVLESAEWPWRLSALPFGGFYSARATMIDPDAWHEAIGGTVQPTHVVVYGAEPVKTPARTTIAWHVRVGDDLSAWYDVERPHTLVALENGAETWVLTAVE